MKDDFRPLGSVKAAPKLKPTPQVKIDTEQVTSFKTPDQVQQHAPFSVALPPEPHAVESSKKPRGSGHHWFNLPWPPTKIEIIGASAVLLIALFGVGGFIKLHQTEAAIAPQSAAKPVAKKPAAVPTTVASTLSGLPVAPEVNQRPVVGVMIENSTAARPQSGLSQAGVVFEAIAEGGVTRFLALFQDQQPANIGPVRSARPYFVQWNEGFQGAYAHVGGSPDALADIKNWNVRDLNQFYNAGAFHRISSRASPHNMYSSVVDLAQLAINKGYSSAGYAGFARKASAPASAPTASSIDFNISGPAYNPHYAYDAKTNTYPRSEGGTVQTDSNTSGQLAPSVVVAMVVPLSAGALDASGARYSNYNPIGTGTAYIFQDGAVTTGTWNKASNTAQIIFNDASGAVVKFNPGQTWISAVDASSKVSYK